MRFMAHTYTRLDRRALTLGVVALGGLTLASGARSQSGQTLRVAAASDLQVVLPALLAAFEARAAVTAKVTYGSTGNLARQIRQGAPFEIFLAADERFVFDLVRDKVMPEAGPVYARGRLALVAQRDQAFHRALLSPDPLEEVATVLRSGGGFRVAIANPEHAPYGQRAIEVLRARKLFDLFEPRLVYGENVAQATQFVATGAAAIGFVSHSVARAPAMAEPA
jgi:molybdate transport system substrate-binding protein